MGIQVQEADIFQEWGTPSWDAATIALTNGRFSDHRVVVCRLRHPSVYLIVSVDIMVDWRAVAWLFIAVDETRSRHRGKNPHGFFDFSTGLVPKRGRCRIEVAA